MLLIIYVKWWFTSVLLLALIICQICLYFVQWLPCMFIRFNVRVEYESFVKNCEDGEASDLLAIGMWMDNLRKAT